MGLGVRVFVLVVTVFTGLVFGIVLLEFLRKTAGVKVFKIGSVFAVLGIAFGGVLPIQFLFTLLFLCYLPTSLVALI